MSEGMASKKNPILLGIVLILIVVGLVAVLNRNKLPSAEQKNAATVRASVATLEPGMRKFLAHNGRFPLQVSELLEAGAKGGPYIDETLIRDAWGTEFQFLLLGDGNCELTSAGLDKAFGTADDVKVVVLVKAKS